MKAILFFSVLLACGARPQSSHRFLLKTRHGLKAEFTSYGARITSLYVDTVNVVLGFEDDAKYATATTPYFGATIGRYGNRIARGSFALDGQTFHLNINNGPNTLHGGKNGFQTKDWQAKQPDDSTVIFSCVSKDGEEGFPGNVNVSVKYGLRNNDLVCEYSAVSDKPTVINLTNHAFFNLNGAGSGTIENHVLQINADRFTPVDSTMIPTGTLMAVRNTPLDFTVPTTIGSRIHDNNLQLLYAKGYDHNFVLKNRHAARVKGNRSNIVMDVFTDEPGLQFYSGNFLQGKNEMRSGPDAYRTAFCLETQHFPDSPNQPSFPSTVLRPGQRYHTVTIFSFSKQ